MIVESLNRDDSMLIVESLNRDVSSLNRTWLCCSSPMYVIYVLFNLLLF